jgi:hypothetical protein
MPYAQPDLFEAPYQGGSETSHAAAVKAADFVGEQGEKVLAWVQQRGAYGATQKEAAEDLFKDRGKRPSMCARFRALELRGDLVNTRAKRDGCAVYVAVQK